MAWNTVICLQYIGISKLDCIIGSANLIALAEYPLFRSSFVALLPHSENLLFLAFSTSQICPKIPQKHILFPKSVFRLKYGKLKSPENAVISALFAPNPKPQKCRFRKTPCLFAQLISLFITNFVILCHIPNSLIFRSISTANFLIKSQFQVQKPVFSRFFALWIEKDPEIQKDFVVWFSLWVMVKRFYLRKGIDGCSST